MNSIRRVFSVVTAGLLAAAVGLSLQPEKAAASPMNVDLRSGYYFDLSGVSLGAGFRTRVGHGSSWDFNPNVEVAFGSHFKEYSINGDVHYDLATRGSMAYWIGAGPAILIGKPDGGSSDTDIGLNVIGGLGGARGAVRPFVQAKGIFSDGTEFALVGGIRF